MKPRCTRVGTTSWAFASDFWDANEKERVATTRGVFVHVKSGRPEPLPEKVAAGLRELVTEDDCDDPFPGAAAMDALAWTEGADGGGDYVVRQSDADSLGHINNARWAHIFSRPPAIDGSGGGQVEVARNAFDAEHPRGEAGLDSTVDVVVAAYSPRQPMTPQFFSTAEAQHRRPRSERSRPRRWSGFSKGDEAYTPLTA